MTGFDLGLHDQFVADHGDRVLWFRATKCSCGRSRDPHRAQPTCVACEGTGWRYDPPVELLALVTGVGGREKSLIEAGLVSPGDMVLGLAPSEPHQLKDWDKIRLTWDPGLPYDGDVLIRGTGSTDRLTYEARRIRAVTDVHPATGAVTTYGEGTSFTVAGRELTWVAGQPQPLAGESYTVDYEPNWDWVVLSRPLSRFERGQSLGQRVLLRQRHLALSYGP